MTNILAVGNWKMNPVKKKDAENLAKDIKKVAQKYKKVTAVLCPPAPYADVVGGALGRVKNLALGAQDMSWQEKGSRTGHVSPLMLKDLGATYAIIGHSELRELGETDEVINKKVRTALLYGITPIVCIGERERDENGFYLGVIHKQIESALQGVLKKDFSSIIFAYEPIWAIGKSARDAMTPHDLYEMSLYIKKTIAGLSSKTIAMNMRVLYGGSVEGENAGALFEGGDVNGFLIGHASIVPSEFESILENMTAALKRLEKKE